MPLTTGTRIGRYEILTPLGAGGMGEVYSARDPQLQRPVALKVLTSSRPAGPEQLERFQREARAIARVTHPHICAVYDVGELDGVPFLVMEHLEGETLAARLARGTLPLGRALVIAEQIAAALDAAHRKGVIHRDLKPRNVMLTLAGAKLLDFGLAKLTRGATAETTYTATSLPLTEEGMVLGTLAYMAPEQVEGRESDARTDIFAVGEILFEMLSGRPAFEGESRGTLMAAVLTHDPPPVSSLAPRVPASVDRIVQKCLAKNPDDRWQSAADLRSALAWSREDATAQRQSAGSSERTRGSARRAAMTLAAGVLLGALPIWFLAVRRDVGAKAQASLRYTRMTFRSGTVSAARFAPDGDTVVYSASWSGDPYAVFMTRRGSSESRPLVNGAKLLGVSSTGDLAFLRGGHDVVRTLPAGAQAGVLARVSLAGGAARDVLDGVVAADWSPGNSELAIVRRDRVEFPVGTTVYGPNAFSFVRVAPDRQRLALIDGHSIVVLDRSGRKTTLSSGWAHVIRLAWSPSGDEVWFTAFRRAPNDTSGWVLRAVSLAGRERVILPSMGAPLAVQDVFRDGRALIAAQVVKMGCLCLPPGQPQTREVSWVDGSGPEALSADGRRVLLSEVFQGAGEHGATYLRETDGSDAIRLGDGFGEDISLDGKWVLTSEVPGREHWILVPTGPGSTRTLPRGPLVGRFEANFLPDGREIVFGGVEKDHGPRIYVQGVANGAVRAISPENVSTDGLATPDGRYVVGRSQEGVFSYPIDGGPPVRLSYVSTDDLPLQWSPDGRSIYVQRADTWPPVIDRVNTATGQRAVWKTIHPADPAGIDSILRIVITPDGQSYCHDYVRMLSELFIVEGLQ